jgi:phosphoglycerate dehydrogenase-like enzyme
MKAVIPAFARKSLEERLPPSVQAVWPTNAAEAMAAMPGAEIAWLDVPGLDRNAAIRASETLRWIVGSQAGLDELDTKLMAERGIVMTNGSGLTSVAVAEYAVMGMLVAAKRYDQVVRMTDRHEWPTRPPGRAELDGATALIVGMGAIGQAVADRLAGFNVAVTGVTRSGRDGTITPDAWRARLGEFDWVVLAAPVTKETAAMIGPAELAAMKPTAWLVNVGRGALVDQGALIEALRAGTIAGAFLDTVTPEPLAADDPLWDAPNALITMHLSGYSQSSIRRRAVDLFCENLAAYLDGRPMRNVVDLSVGY